MKFILFSMNCIFFDISTCTIHFLPWTFIDSLFDELHNFLTFINENQFLNQHLYELLFNLILKSCH